ncbi:MAG: phosphoribosylglycinamide formyltransferase [Dokdonella sp.]|uniref:phosphoribosylglycinamide formyltransferase n=1 Tax=Dokdonella sp. TaxID=2291710 RepID=UPI003264A434
MTPFRIAVLVSGRGSNLQALIDARAAGTLPIEIVLVASDKPLAAALRLAESVGIPTLALDPKAYPERAAFDADLFARIAAHTPDLVVLAGFMRIIDPTVLTPWQGRIINIHPSLLPKYPGLHTHRRAIEAGDSLHGASVHFVTAELDAGPTIAQATLEIGSEDTPSTLAERLLAREHCLIVAVVALIAAGRIAMRGNAVLQDGEPLAAPLQLVGSNRLRINRGSGVLGQTLALAVTLATPMNAVLLPLLLSFAATTPSIAADIAIKPFHADYATLRNGSELGKTTLDLADNGDGTWTLRSDTRGTAGMAKLAGVHIVETSRFRWKDGRPEAVAYDFQQTTAFKDKTRHADFDWKAGDVHVVEGDGDFRYRIEAGIIDRQAVTLAIASDLQRGATSFEYKVAVKDRIETMRYTRATGETLNVPAGDFDVVLMQRDGQPGADRKRVARSWFASSLGWMPVQIEQTEKKGDTVTLKLVSIRK